jgi:hypothetical protein
MGEAYRLLNRKSNGSFVQGVPIREAQLVAPLSRSLPPHPLNMRHVVVKNRLHAAIIPFDGYARPIRFSDGAKVRCCGPPANAFANSECS